MLEAEPVLAGRVADSRPSAPAPGLRERLVLLGILFTFTGATALLAEQVFEKLLSTLLGASTPAAATVLAVYFGGLTLGGLLYARALRGRIRRPLKAYAFFEGAVALWALLLYLAFDAVISFFAPFLALGRDHFWLLQLCRVLVAGCWILPATIPMGASFPAVVDALEQMRVPNHGRAMSAFYACNLLGAILGATLGPFLAFPRWGLDGTLLFVFLVNLTVFAIALGFSSTSPQAAPGASRPESPFSEPAKGRGLLIGIAFLSGLFFFSLEVVWTQLIGTVIGNSVYAFAAMLAMVLVGLGLGAALTAARFPRERHIPVSEIGQLLLAGAILVALLSACWQQIPDTLTMLGGSINSFGAAELLRWSMAAVLLVPPATVLGMVYPSLFRLDSFPKTGSGAAAGELVAANSIGSILGALGSGFGLIPGIGSEITLKVLTCLSLALGLLICLKASPAGGRRRPLTFALLGLALVLFLPSWDRLKLTSGKQVYFASGLVGSQTILKFFHEDTAGGFTTVVDNHNDQGQYRTLLTNGKFQGNDQAEMEAQVAFALAPMMFLEDFRDGLNIGLGTGRTAYTIGAMGFRSVDVAEIAPGIVRAADGWFPHINGRILHDPRTRLFLEDGRNVLLLRPKQYNLITLEVSSVWFAGSTNLYSREFFRLARRRLKPGGVFQQWIQIHHIGIEELSSAIATLRSVFPNVSFWVIGGQGIMVGSERPQRIQPAFLSALEKNHAAIGWGAGELEKRFPDLLACRLLAPQDVSAMTSHYRLPLNTDRNRHFEYFTPRYNNVHKDFATENIRVLSQLASFAAVELAAGADGPLAEGARAVGPDERARHFGLPSRSSPPR